MRLRVPTMEDETLLKDYVREHHECGETSITASMGLSETEYREWIRRIRESETVGNEFGRSLLYLCFEGERLIGLLSVRYALSGELAERYGHIGYGVRPSERRKGYATEMLRRGLEICREKGMREVILGCYRDNIASGATIRRCGGVLYAENDGYKQGRLSSYYHIAL